MEITTSQAPMILDWLRQGGVAVWQDTTVLWRNWFAPVGAGRPCPSAANFPTVILKDARNFVVVLGAQDPHRVVNTVSLDRWAA